MLGKALTTAAAGSAAGGAAGGLGVEDVFSTWLYTGTGGSHTITNGIDFTGEGGLAWIKERDDSVAWHYLFDTERGATKVVSTNNNYAEFSTSSGLTSFTSSGFNLNTDSDVNGSGDKYVSWNFRKAPGFFDVVTWTGDGTSSRNISHALGSTPGFIAVKRTNSSADWWCWHRSISTGNLSGNNLIRLNSTSAQSSGLGTVLGTTSSTTFQVGSDSSVNASGSTYVAYLFAHDEQIFGESADQSVIKCGSFTTDSSYNGSVTLGWEPQWVLVKNASASGDWFIHDVMRGAPVDGNSNWILANSSAAESSSSVAIRPNPTGFTSFNHSANTDMIYIAIRRGPMKTPTDATDVFSVSTSSATTGTITSGFPTDFSISLDRSSSGLSPFSRGVADRLRGKFLTLGTDTTDAENTNASTVSFESNTGIILNTGGVYANGYVHNQFRRAPGFFDMVAYTGTGSARTINHNLGVAPELMLFKLRSTSKEWVVYSSALGASTGLSLTYADGQNSNYGVWNSTAPTATVFSIGTSSEVNSSGNTYISYHFATLDGVSKVGSYTGTAATLNVDCGFSAGARFVLIKRTDSTGDWYVWDTARGIVSGNDPYSILNSTSAEVTTTDYIDPYSAGFTISSSAPAAINASGGSYIFLSIA